MNRNNPIADWSLKSVPADAMRAWSEAARDANPIHIDSAAAEALGFGPRCVNPGPINLAYIVNMIEAALPDAEVTHIDAQFFGYVGEGDSVIARGQLVGEAQDHIVASLECSPNDESLLSADIILKRRP